MAARAAVANRPEARLILAALLSFVIITSDGQYSGLLSASQTRRFLIWVNPARVRGAKEEVRQLAEHDDRDRDGLR